MKVIETHLNSLDNLQVDQTDLKLRNGYMKTKAYSRLCQTAGLKMQMGMSNFRVLIIKKAER